MSTERLDICDRVPVPAAIAPVRPEIPFLAGLDEEAAEAVRARMTSIAVAGGRTLFEEGDAPNALYTLVSGAVGLSAREPPARQRAPPHAPRPTRSRQSTTKKPSERCSLQTIRPRRERCHRRVQHD